MDKRDMLPVYFDCEFTGLHQGTTLISIGCVTENRHYFYAEFNDYDRSQVDEFVKENVIGNLLFKEGVKVEQCHLDGIHMNVMMTGNSREIHEMLTEWLEREAKISNQTIQMYSDCLAYDWVLFNNLICKSGNAKDLQGCIYYIPADLCTAFQCNGIDPDVSREGFLTNGELTSIRNNSIFKDLLCNAKHNSLWDAYVIRECFKKI